MSEFQITTHVSPPQIRIGRPPTGRWNEFRTLLEKARPLASEWVSLTLPQDASVLYALRLAREAGFKVSRGDSENEIKVLYMEAS